MKYFSSSALTVVISINNDSPTIICNALVTGSFKPVVPNTTASVEPAGMIPILNFGRITFT